jgi:protein required for attachment to host cells
VSLVAILLPLGISQEQDVRKETKNNSELETEHQERSGSSFSHHAAKSDTDLSETLAGMC